LGENLKIKTALSKPRGGEEKVIVSGGGEGEKKKLIWALLEREDFHHLPGVQEDSRTLEGKVFITTDRGNSLKRRGGRTSYQGRNLNAICLKRGNHRALSSGYLFYEQGGGKCMERKARPPPSLYKDSASKRVRRFV